MEVKLKENSRFFALIFLLLILCLILVLTSSFFSCKGKVRNYAEGFSLKHPKDWEACIIEKEEKHILIAPRNEEPRSGFILVYPFFLKDAVGSRLWLEKNLSLFKDYFTQLNFQKLEQIRSFPDESAARFSFKKKDIFYEGIALCSIYEKSGILYVISSAKESFPSRKNVLLSSLKSFRFEKPINRKGEKKGEPKKKKIIYTLWTDPSEQAFTLEVPHGWEVDGGTFRRAAVDLVHFLKATSPDSRISIQFNDKDIPVFTIPNDLLAISGFRKGSWYSPGYGVRMLVRRYLPGHLFLVDYLQNNYRRGLSDFELIEQKERSDYTAEFNKIYSHLTSYGISFTLDAGEASFRFSKDGEPFVGYGLSLTQVVKDVGVRGGNWSVILLVIYACPEKAAEKVREIATHMFESVRINPFWLASQQFLTAQVSRIVTQTSREISRIIDQSYWMRQKTLDDINRRFSNYILGVTDVIDPETGETWRVEAGHNYYWRKDYTNLIVGTKTADRPDIDFSLLEEF